MRHLIHAIITFFLSCYLSIQWAAPIHAIPVATGSQAEKSFITSIWHDVYDLEALTPIRIIQKNPGDEMPVYEFIFTLRNVTAQVQHPDGSTEEISLKVIWNITDSSYPHNDYSIIGSYEEIGQIKLPNDGYAFEEGVLQQLILPTEVVAPTEKTVISSFEDYSDEIVAYAVTTGSDLSAILLVQDSTWRCYEEQVQADGSINTIPHYGRINWDTSQIDLTRAGVYDLIGSFELPDNSVLADGVTPPTRTVPISVQEPGKPDINCYTIVRRFIQFPYVTPPGDLSKLQPWYSQNGGEWQPLPNSNGNSWSDAHLSLDRTFLIPGSTYQLQLNYDGGSSGILTFTYDDSLIIESYNEGDRDGGDTDGGIFPLPPNEDSNDGSADESIPQPPAQSIPNSRPTSPIEPDSSAAGQETAAAAKNTAADNSDPRSMSSCLVDSKNKLAEDEISGASLLLMLSSKQKAPFSSDGINVVFSEDALLELNLLPEDRILVNIRRQSEQVFSLHVTHNDAPIHTLKDTTIMVPYQPQSQAAVLNLQNSNQEIIATGTYNARQKLVIFTVNHTGIFSIIEEEISPAAATPTEPIPTEPVPAESVSTESVLTESAPDEQISPDLENKKNSSFTTPMAVIGIVTILLIILFFLYHHKRRNCS